MTRRTQNHRGAVAAPSGKRFGDLMRTPREGPVELIPTPFRLILRKGYDTHTMSYEDGAIRRYSATDWYERPSAEEVSRFLRDVREAAKTDEKIAAFLKDKPERRLLFHHMAD